MRSSNSDTAVRKFRKGQSGVPSSADDSVFMDRVRDATGIHRLLSSPYGAWGTEGPLMLATVQNGGAGRLYLAVLG